MRDKKPPGKRRPRPSTEKTKRADECELEELLFGDAPEASEGVIDGLAAADSSDSEGDDEGDRLQDDSWTPAWEDSDDEAVAVEIDSGRRKKLRKTEAEDTLNGREYAQRLREFHAGKSKGNHSWAVIPSRSDAGDGESDEDSEFSRLEALLRNSGSVLASSILTKRLAPSVIDMKRMKDANHAAPSQAVVQDARFHGSLPLMLTAGYDKTLRIFQIDGDVNPKLQSVFVPDMPMRRAAWLHRSNEVLMVGRRKFYYIYDLGGAAVHKIHGIPGRDEKSLEDMCLSPDGRHIAFLGNNGYVILVSARTRQWVANLKLNGTARSFAFSADGEQIAAAGGDGRVTVWDIGTRRCVYVWNDEGAVKTCALAPSPDGKLWASGADSGVVNIYKTREVEHNENPTPERAIMNLTTAIDTLRFNADSQVLAYSSRFTKDALKLVHVPSNTVFANWPTLKTPLRTVASVDFNASSGLLGIGNDRGKVLLYQLQHYQST